MNSATGILHHQARVDRIDPVAILKCRVANLFAVVVTWHERSRQRRQLLDLDDRLLKDVGISRADALAASARPFWHD
ncbi:MAG: hypothetical protein DRR03_02085 [Gammaproteobacteria bacterium]|nr:MAG: hypothetical protein DRR03_02085 [Gammaproteobacteria bacterium]